MAKKRTKGGKLKTPMSSPVLWAGRKAKREKPSNLPPGRYPREYDLNRLDKGGTKAGGIWELSLFPFEGLAILAEEVRERARAQLAEKPELEEELLDLRVLLERDQITEEEFKKREREIRAKYEKK